MDTKTIEIESLKVLQLQPNDVLVLTCETLMSDSEKKNVSTRLAKLFPNKILILDSGVDIAVIRKANELSS